MTHYTDDELLAANDAGMEWDHNRHDERTRAEAILDAVAPAIAARALREAAELVSDANVQGLGLGAAFRSIQRRADEIEAAP